MESNWNSRRSVVLGRNGICSSSQSLATAAGVKILQKGGSAADAAVAMAACLNVIEPCSTGIGGDAFSLYYEASSKKVTCLQGNGASSSNFSFETLKSKDIGNGPGLTPLDPHSGLCVTTPGAAALWEDLVKEHGNLSMADVMAPAIDLATSGFPMGPVTSEQWSKAFIQGQEAHRVLHPGGKPPATGQVFYNPDLASTFRSLAAFGAKEGFYKGRIADSIIKAVHEFGGVLTHEDLQKHETAREDPISVVYKGLRVYETPPPTQGLAALIGLALIEKVENLKSNETKNPSFDDKVLKDSYFDFENPDWKRRGSVEEAHKAIECLRLAWADALQHIADPRTSTQIGGIPVEQLLSDNIITERAKLISLDKSVESVKPTDLLAITEEAFKHGDTCYFCCVDVHGNACSMINSNYMQFGTGIMPEGTGFTLQNRGFNFSMTPGHPNEVGPNKRPYHTIIPSLATFESDGSLFGVFGNMGGFMQPMGHVQVLRNMVDFHLNPQEAVDAPRWYVDGLGKTQSASDVDGKSEVTIEDGYGGRFDGDIGGSFESQQQDKGEETFVAGLNSLGHSVKVVRGLSRNLYGRAQIILRNPKTGVQWAGSDPRTDGCAAAVV